MDKDTLLAEIEGYENELSEIERLASYPICYFPEPNKLRKIELKSLIAEKRKQLGELVELEESERLKLENESLKLDKQIEETRKSVDENRERVNALEDKWIEKANSDLDFLLEQYEGKINHLKFLYAEQTRLETALEGHREKLNEFFTVEETKKYGNETLTAEQIQTRELGEAYWIKHFENELSELNSPILNSEMHMETLWKRIEKLNKKLKRREKLAQLETL